MMMMMMMHSTEQASCKCWSLVQLRGCARALRVFDSGEVQQRILSDKDVLKAMVCWSYSRWNGVR